MSRMSAAGKFAIGFHDYKTELRQKAKENARLRSENEQLRNRVQSLEAFIAYHRSQGSFGNDDLVSSRADPVVFGPGCGA